MQVDPRMYDRPMTEEEKRLMMIQGLRQNNMSMANADEKKTITLDQVSTTVSELPTKVSSWGKSEWEKTKDFQKKSWAEAKTKWPWNQIFKRSEERRVGKGSR